jgi:hypothetical protein
LSRQSAAIIRILLTAAAPVPATLWEDAPQLLTMVAGLGVSVG